MTEPVPARYVGSTIAPALAAPAVGAVLAAFSRSCYLDLTSRIIALVSPELLRGPLNIVVDPQPVFAFEQLPAGAAVRLTPPRLIVASFIDVDLAGASVWNARLAPTTLTDRALLRSRLDRIKTVLAEVPAESLARPEGRPARAVEGMDALYAGLRSSDPEMIALGASRLAGLGAGLTPSGDDVLTGVLVAASLLVPPATPQICRRVFEAVRDRTTRISVAYIDAAAQGEVGEAWHILARSLDSGPDSAVDAAAARVLRFGETSGADMLTGFLLAMSALDESTQSTRSAQSTQLAADDDPREGR